VVKKSESGPGSRDKLFTLILTFSLREKVRMRG
jgi:hypothetical protein